MGMVARTACAGADSAVTVLPELFVTSTRVPAGFTARPMGSKPTATRPRAKVAASTVHIVSLHWLAV